MIRSTLSHLSCSLLVCGAATGALHGQEDLTLRINDVDAVAGGMAAISVRTYASRPMSQGQLCFRTRGARASRGAGLGPIESIDSWEVFSSAGDATATVELTPTGDGLDIDFASPSATVNDVDGPILVVYVFLRSDLAVGEAFELDLELGQTHVFDENGQPIQVLPRAGELDVVSPTAPLQISAEAHDTLPGGTALLSVQTKQLELLSGGYLEYHFPAAIADGSPTAWIDSRFGDGTVSVDETTPGVLEIQFDSPPANLNRLPGDIIQIAVPIRADAPTGSTWPISIDPGSAVVLDANGAQVPLTFENGTLTISAGELFADGFEWGDTSEWSLTTP